MANAPVGFDRATRSKFIPVAVTNATRVSGGQSQANIPQTGYMGRLWGTVRGTINAVTSGPNAFGQSAIINRMRLQSSGSVDLINISGPGYFHLLKPVLDMAGNSIPYTSGLTAIANAGVVKLDFVIPVEVNFRDQVGFFTMQNRETLVTFKLDWETDAVVATGGITWTTQPVLLLYMELFTVPEDRANQPALTTVHAITEDQSTVSAAGAYTYYWPLGNTVLQMIHGAGFAASGADSWTRYQLRVNQSDYLFDVDPTFMDIYHSAHRLLTRALGVIPIDLIGQSGLGTYDVPRDVINTGKATDIASIVTTTGALTLYSVRREIIPLGV